MVEDKGLNHAVKMMINIGDTDILKLYQKCAVFLYTPSREHFGIGPIEAMACGKPVIVPNYGGPKETVIHQVTGFRLPNNPRIWAQNIVKLLGNSDLRKMMGQAARRHAERNFIWERTVSTIESVLREIVQR